MAFQLRGCLSHADSQYDVTFQPTPAISANWLHYLVYEYDCNMLQLYLGKSLNIGITTGSAKPGLC